MAFVGQPNKVGISSEFYNTEEFKAGLTSALTRSKENFALGLAMVAARVVRSAKSYAVVKTGRMKASIFQSEVKYDGEKMYIEVGVTLQSLQQASASAGAEVYNAAKTGRALGTKGMKQTLARSEVPTTNYPYLIEFGDSKHPAKPFMRPALAEIAGYFKNTMKGK